MRVILALGLKIIAIFDRMKVADFAKRFVKVS